MHICFLICLFVHNNCTSVPRLKCHRQIYYSVTTIHLNKALQFVKPSNMN